MSNYTKITDFAAKDALLHGNPSKVVTGTGLGAEFDAIATAVATKVDVNGALGTPSSGVATNLTGIAAGLTAGNATNATNATNASQLGGVAASGYARSGANADITSMTALTAPTVAANPLRATDLQVQAVTAFTTGGTATAFTLTPAPAITANAANQRFRVTFNAAAGTTPTLAVSGQAALALKYRDSTGAKQAITATQVPINWASDVVNDGTDWVVENVAIIPGVTTNSSALTGYIGEYVESTVALGAAVSLTTGVTANVTSISLTAGDWDVSGVVIMNAGGTTNVTRVSAGTSSTSGTADVTKGYYSHIHSGYVPGSGQFRAMPLNTSRFSLSGTTTIYLVALANFTVSTCTAYGTISARRVR